MIRSFLVIYTLFFVVFPFFSKEKENSTKYNDKVEYVEVIGDVPVTKSIQSITIIDEEKIDSFHFQNLKDILSISPGVLTLSNGKFGQTSSTFIRGSKNTQILYLIDGIKIRDESSIGGINLSLIPAFLINKVEVVRGPLSSIYGSDAMGGVINIDLYRKKGLKSLFSAGSFGSYQANISLGNNTGDLFYSITSSVRNYRDTTDNDRFKNTGISGRLDYKGRGTFKTGLLFFLNNVNSGIPYNNSGELSPYRKFKSNSYLVAIPVTFFSNGSSTLKTTLSYTGNSYKFEDRDDLWSPYYSNSSRNFEIDTLFNRYIGKKFNISSGLNYSTGTIYSENHYGVVVNNSARNYFSAFTKIDADLGKLFFTTSIRYDKYKDVKSNFSPQLGVSFMIGDKVKLRTSFSKSFKAPLLLQQINPWGFSNFDLLPERGLSGEMGADIFLKNNIVGFSFFTSIFKDMIDWVTVDPVTWQGQYKNIKEAKVKGFEISFSSSMLKNIRFDISYTYMKSTDSLTGLPLKRRPENLLSSTISYINRFFNVNLRMVYVGKREDMDFLTYPPDMEMPSYNVYDLNISVPLHNHISIYGKVTNLFNSQYSEIFGYPSPGRRFEAGIIYR